jgi:hypothetical protein
MTTRFHGMHSHALTNTVFHYDGELSEQASDLASWRAVVRLQDKVVETLAGNVAFDPALMSATQAAIAEVHTLIDARDHEQAPLA